MSRRHSSNRSLRTPLVVGALTLGLLSSIYVVADRVEAAQEQQRMFTSPEEGVAALVDALRKDDAQALESILGPDASEVLSSGDPVADKNAKNEFLRDYDAKSSLVPVNATTQTLQVGETDWPLPIPLVSEGSMWHFDLDAGIDELLNRRIGRNEASTIQSALAFVDAEREYASVDRDGDGILEYAQRFRSTPGMKDGLYWPVQAGEPESPLGPLFAAAQAEGYRVEPADDNAPSPTPYHGYYYKILTAQGPAAPGGAYDYIVDGKMIGGVALIAYPAEYGDSGVMSFIVNHDGIIYQKDLGPETPDIASTMTVFDPENTWQSVQSPIPVAAAP